MTGKARFGGFDQFPFRPTGAFVLLVPRIARVVIPEIITGDRDRRLALCYHSAGLHNTAAQQNRRQQRDEHQRMNCRLDSCLQNAFHGFLSCLFSFSVYFPLARRSYMLQAITSPMLAKSCAEFQLAL